MTTQNTKRSKPQTNNSKPAKPTTKLTRMEQRVMMHEFLDAAAQLIGQPEARDADRELVEVLMAANGWTNDEAQIRTLVAEHFLEHWGVEASQAEFEADMTDVRRINRAQLDRTSAATPTINAATAELARELLKAEAEQDALAVAQALVTALWRSHGIERGDPLFHADGIRKFTADFKREALKGASLEGRRQGSGKKKEEGQ